MNIPYVRVRDIVDAEKPVDTGLWRWGHTQSYVKKYGDKHYMFTARFHVQEGLQEEDCNAYEVVPVEKTIVEWKRAIQNAPVVQSEAPHNVAQSHIS